MIPSTKKCLRLLEKYGTSRNVIRHCKKVAELARKIGRRNKANVKLLNAAGLLHDITQGKAGKAQEKEVRKILEAENCKEIIPLLKDYSMSPKNLLKMRTKEKRILKYCDSRVMENKIFSVETRLEDAMLRYPERAEGFRKCIPILKKWERGFGITK
ncbi:MAG: HD domain-containing protein [archaeon]